MSRASFEFSELFIIIIPIMCNVQKCSRRKVLSKFILSTLFLTLAINHPAASQTNAAVQLNLPLKYCQSSLFDATASENTASDNEIILVSSLDKVKLYAVSVESGLYEWQINIGGQLQDAPYLSGDNLFVILRTETEYLLRKLEKQTGVTLWQERISTDRSTPLTKFYPHLTGNKLLIADSEGDWQVYDSAKGGLLTAGRLSAPLTAVPYFEGEQAVFGTTDRRITLFSIESLREISNFNLPAVPSIVFKTDSRILWSDGQGILSAFENRGTALSKTSITSKTSRLWKFRVGGQISALTRTGGNIMVSSLDNYVYLVLAENGEINWKKRLAGRIALPPLLSGNYAVLISVGDSSATVIEVSSGKTVNKVSLAEGNFFTELPVVSGRFIFFPTAAGLFAYTSEKSCGSLTR